MASINLDLDHLPLTNMEQLKDKVDSQLHQQLQDMVMDQLQLLLDVMSWSARYGPAPGIRIWGQGHRPASAVADVEAAAATVAG